MWDNFWRAVIFVALVAALTTCASCAMGGNKGGVEHTLDTLSDHCDFDEIKFRKDTDEPMLDEVSCHPTHRHGI